MVFAQNSPLPPIGSVSTQTQSCIGITKNLSIGSRGSDVIQLQQYLISQNLLAADSATGYFGRLTEAAVQQWQSSRGVVSSGTAATTGYGAVGPKTRAALTNASSGVSTTSSINTTCIQNTINALLAQVKTLQEQISRLTSGNITSNAPTNTVTTYTQPTTYTYTPSNPSTSSGQATSPASCSWNGGMVANGSNVPAYQTSSVAAGSQCVSQQRTCTNGTLSGSYANASCSVTTTTNTTAASCSFNGQTVTNGSSVTAYQSASAAYGSQCVSESRACTNGILSGSYTNASCTVAASTVTATAIASYQDNLPANTLDVNENSYWNSGGFPPRWIEFDLGAPMYITTITLTVVQDPDGMTTHEIYAGSSPHPTQLVRIIRMNTHQGDVITEVFSPALTNIRYVRVKTTASPSSWVAWGTVRFDDKVTAAKSKTLASTNIQQFGYFFSGGDPNVIPDVAPISNIAWVTGWTQEDLVAKVAQANQLGLGVVLDIERIVSVWNPNLGAGTLAIFDSLWTAIAPYRNSVKGIYIVDEPFMNNVDSGISDTQITANLNAIEAHVHATAPNIPTIIIFGYPEIRRANFFSKLLPRNTDWIGFDCYLNSGDPCATGKVRGDFDSFLQNKSPNQKIVLVPGAYWGSAPDSSIDTQIADRLSLYREFAQNPEVVAIYPFIYQAVPGEIAYGAESLPITLDALINWFDELMGM